MKPHALALRAVALRAATCALSVCLGASGAAAFAGKRVVKAHAKSRIEVVAQSANVRLVGWDKDELQIETASGDAPAVRSDGDELVVRADPGEELDLVVHYPAGAALDARSMSGDVEVRGCKGRTNVRSVSGEVRVDGADGALRASSVSGGVRVKGARAGARVRSVSGLVKLEGVTGALRASSVSGEVTVTAAAVTSAALQSHSGEVTFEGTVAPTGHLRGKSFSGNVRVTLAQKDFRVRARSRSGSVRVQGLAAAAESESRAQGQVGQGGADLELSAFSGNVVVRTR